MAAASFALPGPLTRLSPATVALPFGILTIIVLLVLPIPTTLLDALFVLNIALSVAILMVAMNAAKPLDFSSFPSVLLFATLLRLALNVASTRIVLVNGHQGEGAAGAVIESFGRFLVGGDFAVGLFVFVILLIINMVVITKGAGRVSEVSARFTLDALPGKQMAIDSDIAAGLMTSEEAKARRAEISTEADFYGAMDGASKFVKGDAVAALLILAVNIIGGLTLGMVTHDLGWGEAAERYVTLSVGDALVAQVPALLLSIAAAVIVTRVSDKSDLAGHIAGQFADSKSWLPVGFVLLALGCIPAMPQMVFLPAGAATFALAHWLRKQRAALAQAEADAAREPPPSPDAIAIEDVSDHTLVTLELGYSLVHLVDEAKGAPLVARIAGVRKQLSQELGFVVPQLRVRDSLDIAPDAYRILLGGVEIGGSSIRSQRMLAIDVGEANPHARIPGEATSDPSFHCPALWIEAAERENAVAEGYLVVDASTIVATQLSQLLSARADNLLGPEEVRAALDALKERMPGLVEAVTPDPLSLAALTRLLKLLVADGITLAHPVPLLASLASALQQTTDTDQLVDRIRADLGAQLVARACPPAMRLPVITLEAELESAILQGLRDPATRQVLIDPELAARIAGEIASLAEACPGPASPALIVQPPARRPLAAMLKQRVPQAIVLSIAELPASQPIEVLAVIGRNEAAQQEALPA